MPPVKRDLKMKKYLKFECSYENENHIYKTYHDKSNLSEQATPTKGIESFQFESAPTKACTSRHYQLLEYDIFSFFGGEFR